MFIYIMIDTWTSETTLMHIAMRNKDDHEQQNLFNIMVMMKKKQQQRFLNITCTDVFRHSLPTSTGDDDVT